MNLNEQKHAATLFYGKWKNKGDEKQHTQQFWIDFLQNVCGKENTTDFISFEKPVTMRNGGVRYIDGYVPSSNILIEQKGFNVDLDKREKQSGGDILTPYEQALRYDANLPYNEKARWIVVSNFNEFRIYNMNQKRPKPTVISLYELPDNIGCFSFFRDNRQAEIAQEQALSMRAGQLVGMLYDALRNGYDEEDRSNSEVLHSLNVLCVRLVFCLYAEDAGLFGNKDAFINYLSGLSPDDAREKLIKFFGVLNSPEERRNKYDGKVNLFPFVNGGLFGGLDIIIPPFTDEILHVLLNDAGKGFNWSSISPTIFGAVFESTLDSKMRHDGGMHYTSIENIHKVIDSLFLNELRSELDSIKTIAVPKTRNLKLLEFQKKMASLTFFDPAAGSGNFLTETFLCLRKMENECIAMRQKGQSEFDFGDSIYVNIYQFYGIEVNDFAVAVAVTALWIAESQMAIQTSEILQRNIDFLPLKTYKNMKEANALKTDWNEVVPSNRCSYIIGNPPFMGARVMSEEQKSDLQAVFGKGYKGVGNLDYVAAWYMKAATYIQETNIRCALVSTNSITQGEQVSLLWKPLLEKLQIYINFAYRTFIWNSEAFDMAHVHCVIIGFSSSSSYTPIIYQSNGIPKIAKNINGYLMDAPNVFIENRTNSLCNNVPEARSGNKPIDGGNYLFLKEEKEEFIRRERGSESFFHRWFGAEEFINNGSFRIV